MRLPGGGAPVRAILFDYGWTLVDIVTPHAALSRAHDRIADLLAQHGFARPDAIALQSAVHDRVDQEIAEHERGGSLDEVDVAALERRAFAEAGFELAAEVREACSTMIQRAWYEGVHPYPDAIPTLRRLRAAGLRLGLCSNAPYRAASLRQQLTHVGLAPLLDAAVFSSEVGRRKPAPEIFAAALDALGEAPQAAVMVGDRLREDVGGGAAAGLRTVLIQRGGAGATAAPVAPGARREAVELVPDAVVASLQELAGLVLGHRSASGAAG